MDIDRFLNTSEKLDLTGIDWDEARRIGLTDAEKYTLTYFADIEQQTIIFMREILGTKAALEPDVMAFLGMWNYEELFHGRALAHLLEVCGAPLDGSRAAEVRERARFVETFNYVATVGLSKLMPDTFTALYMAWGAAQEITTLRGYETVIANTKNSVLREICERIAKQERRHFAWYFNSARERLAKSAVTRVVVREIMLRSWAPVGAGVKSDDEVVELFRCLFPGALGPWLAGEVDAKMASLPGLAGVELMGTYVRQMRARSAPASAELALA